MEELMWHVTLCPIRLQEGKMKKKRKLWNSRSDSVGVWESCLLSIFVPISSNQENERLHFLLSHSFKCTLTN